MNPKFHLPSRRQFLADFSYSFAGMALAGFLQDAHALPPLWRPNIPATQPSAPRPPMGAPKAKRLLVIHCSGGVSQMDSFDWKPELLRMDGKPMPGSKANFVTFQGENGDLAKPQFDFQPRGQCGKPLSNLFPRIAALADELCFIHSMTAKSNTHGPAESQMTTGFVQDGFPSLGAWVTYALGSESQEMPAFVAIPDPRGVPMGGVNVWGNGFLPAVFQGTTLGADRPLQNLSAPKGVLGNQDSAAREVLRFLNSRDALQYPGDNELAARIASHELAARMQLAVPEVTDLKQETQATLDAYGVTSDRSIQSGFARNCLLARRLLERGVRCVQLHHGSFQMGVLGSANWDGHKELKPQYQEHAKVFDLPVAALLTDLRQRGLLDDTLVLWTTEFGRMPTFQKGAQGRDHNPEGFTVWLTGAGVKRGFSYGATDEFGHRAVENVCSIYDLHATVLHLLGLQHEQLRFYHNGIERRLTDVHGEVLHPVLA
jgi:uncharacterized protein (DUF1501 family)